MKFRKSFWLVVLILAAMFLSSCNIGATPAPTQDLGAIQTQAYGIVLTEAAIQQTQTAAAIPPTLQPTNTLAPTPTLSIITTVGVIPTSAGGTNTPIAFNTQQPGLTPQLLITPTIGVINTVTTKNGCNDAAFLAETEPYDKSTVPGGKEFSKGWMLSNTGTCTWDEGYVFDYLQDYFPDINITQLEGYDISLKKNTEEEYTKPGHGQTFIVKLKPPAKAGEYKAYWKLKDDAGTYFGPLVYVWVIVK